MIINKMKPNTLYIIGNGFDLKHQIHSSYNDFSNWLIKNYRFDSKHPTKYILTN